MAQVARRDGATNFLFFSNPVAVRKALESGGESLQRGFELFMEDMQAGTVRMTSPEHFRVGENLATTPSARWCSATA